MSQERRVKQAFEKVKEDRDRILFDMNILKNRIEKHDKALTLNEDVKQQLNVLRKVNLEKFVAKLDKEIDEINSFIGDIESRTELVNKVMKNFTHQMEVHQVQYEDMKAKVKEAQKQAQNNKIDMKVINQHTAEFERLLDEKVALENGALRLEMQTGFAEDSIRMNKLSDRIDELVRGSLDEEEAIPEIFEEFAVMTNDKINSEMRKLRAELATDVATIKRQIREGIKEVKVEMRESVAEAKKAAVEAQKAVKSSSASSATKAVTKTASAPKKAAPKKTAKATSSKPAAKKAAPAKKKTSTKTKPVKKAASRTSKKQEDGRFKKAVKWLFVDEEDEEAQLAQVKSQVR